MKTQEHTFDLNEAMAVTYTLVWVDESFAHEFGTRYQGGYELEGWELCVRSGERSLSLHCDQVPEALYTTIEELIHKDMEKRGV